MSVTPVLTPAEAQRWDRLAEASGRPLHTLMECAGRNVAQLILDRFRSAANQGVLIACGPGHNGGDGWVAARTLHRLGIPVWVVAPHAARAELTVAMRQAAATDGVRELSVDGPWPAVGLVVDALLGTGAEGAPRGAVATLLERLSDLARPIVAVDGPSGLDLATGVSHNALPAAMTITFGGARRGHLLARDDVGDLVITEIGLPPGEDAWPRLLGREWAARQLPPFRADLHKGVRGRIVIVGGDEGMTGAVRLASRSAFAAGAGLVHVVAPSPSAAILRTAEPDLQVMAHDFAAPLSRELQELLANATAVVLGPGLGRAAERTAFVLAVIGASERLVLDADALVVLRQAREELKTLCADRVVVMTPHIGEFRTLFPAESHSLETDPWSAAANASAEMDCTVLLKGVPTVIATPGEALLTVAAGNPGLATGGSGDLLAGMLGCFLAQLETAAVAAAVAAQALGDAADHAARRRTARALRPMDVVASLPEVWRQWGRGPAVPTMPVLAERPSPRMI